KVPFNTVTFSSVGCQCAGILAPSTQRRRTTNGAPSALGSPDTVARSHPFMIGVHFKSPKCMILGGSGLSFFSWPCIAGTSKAAPTSATHARPTAIFFIRLSSVKSFGTLDWPKDTPLPRPRQYKFISPPPTEHHYFHHALDLLETPGKSRASK